MRFLSVCSGIEAASVAWNPLGWHAAAFSEIEPFPCAVLAHHYPNVPNLGDMTTIARRVLTGEVEAPDVLTGGTPCQAFSVAGLRESLSDARGNLSLKFVELADAIDHIRRRAGKPASIVVWENVPGVLSTKDNAFGCFLAGLAGEDDALEPPGGRWADSGCVYGPARAIAWRTLDAQYFGLAQRRRRVFVVASARDGFDPATVLFEWQGLRRDSAPSRETREGSAASAALSVARRGREGGGTAELGDDLGMTLRASSGGGDKPHILEVAHTLRGEGFDASEDGTGRGTPPVPVAYAATDYESGAFGEVDQAAPLTTSADRTRAAPVIVGADCWNGQVTGEVAATMGARGSSTTASGPTVLAFSAKDHGADATDDLRPTLRAGGHSGSHANAGVMPAIQMAAQVRRLTPRECERLQGFPDDYTAVPHRGKPAADGPRYKALGNSWAVPCARWIGQRIAAVEAITAIREAA